MNDVFERVAAIIEDITDIPQDEIEENSSFIEDLDLSSLEIMSIVAQVEREFSRKISEKELMSIATAGELVRILK